jgi:hypothetical protein
MALLVATMVSLLLASSALAWSKGDSEPMVITDANEIRVWNVPPPPGLQGSTRRTTGSRSLMESSPPPTTLSVLVVRVTAEDGEPDFSADQLYQLIFDDAVSLKQQLHQCSFGALDLTPTSYGVLDVSIQMTAFGRSTYTIVSAAEDAGLDLITSSADADSTDSRVTRLRDFANLTMIVLPPGTLYRGLQDWAGYASVNGMTSVYNNRWGGSLSTAAHEVGHNLGLRHANERGRTYADQTGYMGSAYEETGYPQQCFNAQNHWHLKWYVDRRVTVNPEDPVLLKVAAFVDYHKTIEGSESVLVRVGQDHYFQYNRAKSFNIGTKEDKDRLTVVRDDGDGTSLLIGMDSRSTNFFYVEDFEGSRKRLNIEVCAESMGIIEADADLMLVSVGFGESMCPPPTYAPSPALVAPITAPTLASTRLPTRIPTIPDSMIKVSGTLTPTPAAVATTGSTLIPTHLPTTSLLSAPTGSPEFLPIAGRPGTSESPDYSTLPPSDREDSSESAFGEVVGKSAIDFSGVYRASASSLGIAFLLTITLALLA